MKLAVITELIIIKYHGEIWFRSHKLCRKELGVYIIKLKKLYIYTQTHV